jgi:hypothetical protein
MPFFDMESEKSLIEHRAAVTEERTRFRKLDISDLSTDPIRLLSKIYRPDGPTSTTGQRAPLLENVYLRSADLHVPQTLDRTHYLHLASTRDRDYDQVISRHTRNSTVPSLLMVNRLWLWKIDARMCKAVAGARQRPNLAQEPLLLRFQIVTTMETRISRSFKASKRALENLTVKYSRPVISSLKSSRRRSAMLTRHLIAG